MPQCQSIVNNKRAELIPPIFDLYDNITTMIKMIEVILFPEKKDLPT